MAAAQATIPAILKPLRTIRRSTLGGQIVCEAHPPSSRQFIDARGQRADDERRLGHGLTRAQGGAAGGRLCFSESSLEPQRDRIRLARGDDPFADDHGLVWVNSRLFGRGDLTSKPALINRSSSS